MHFLCFWSILHWFEAPAVSPPTELEYAIARALHGSPRRGKEGASSLIWRNPSYLHERAAVGFFNIEHVLFQSTILKQCLQVDLWWSTWFYIFSSCELHGYSSLHLQDGCPWLRVGSNGFPSGVVCAILDSLSCVIREPWGAAGWWRSSLSFMVASHTRGPGSLSVVSPWPFPRDVLSCSDRAEGLGNIIQCSNY